MRRSPFSNWIKNSENNERARPVTHVLEKRIITLAPSPKAKLRREVPSELRATQSSLHALSNFALGGGDGPYEAKKRLFQKVYNIYVQDCLKNPQISENCPILKRSRLLSVLSILFKTDCCGKYEV